MEVVQLDDPLEAGLQVAILFEHPLILGADGLLDSDDLAADFVVEFGGVGISRPVGEHRLRPAPLVRCPDDDHDFDPAAAIPKRLPEFAVRGTPGAERRRGLVAGIEVDEDGALGVKRDREPEREVAPEVPGRSPVDPPGQEPALDAERLEGGHTAPALFAREVTKGPRRSPAKSRLTHKIARIFPDSSR